MDDTNVNSDDPERKILAHKNLEPRYNHPQSAKAANQLSPPPPPRPPPPAHKRTYQACIPCRQRKVRCDLGSVEAPHDPPCVRCRRESKDCYFSVTRRKRAPSVDVQPGMGRGRGIATLGNSTEQDDIGSFKRPRTLGPDDQQYRSPDYSTAQRSPSYPLHPPLSLQPIDPRLDDRRHHRPPPLQRISQLPAPPPPTATTTADTLLQTEVYNSHEALLTLIEAAGKDTPLRPGKAEADSPSTEEGNNSGLSHVRQGKDSADHSRIQSPATSGPGRWNQNVRFSSVPSDEGVGGTAGSHASSHARRKSVASAISPGIQGQRNQSTSTGDDGMEKTLRAWSKFRFVKAGWFTAKEAVSLVEYFYHHLHPLSPTLTSSTLLHVSHPRYHPLLLRYEPFLTMTILTVTSRFMVLPGPGGKSRLYALHDMLWREIRGGFERLMWGGGWSVLGVPRQQSPSFGDADNGAKTGRGLRTLGTVEGLLILTEWHVRGLNFPLDVEEADWGVDGISDDEDEDAGRSDRGKASAVRAADGGVVEGLGELASRSDHMSWMLLGNALALAYELGVFDEVDDTVSATAVMAEPATTPFRIRAQRMQKLLLVYVLQLASRLGWTSMIPSHLSQSVSHKITPAQTPSSTNSRGWSDDDELQDVVFSSWVELTMLMKSSSDMLFPNRSVTKSIMRSGRYVPMLEHFQPLLRSWKRRLDDHHLPSPICHIMSMEYDHVRFYINSLALQAVVDRCSLRPPPSPTPAPFAQQSNQAYRTPSAASNNPSGGNRGAFKALLEMSTQDIDFIREVVDASRSLLTTVTEEMYPNGYLKHAPVRIYLRILSAAMFLLKTFALGEKEVEVRESLRCIDGAVAAMRGAAVDDVTLGGRFADLLEVLTGRVKGRFESLRMRRTRESASSRPGSPLGMEMEEEAVVGDAPPSVMQQQPQQNLPQQEMQADNIDQNGPETMYDGGGGWAPHSGGYENWLALPLDPILGFEGVTSQGSMGVDVGGVDLLEILLAGGSAHSGGH